VRKALERMGGRVGLESALGGGSKFWIELPGSEGLAAVAN
jgi:signal transduction histidine kinase